jgi:hypothetical protein
MSSKKGLGHLYDRLTPEERFRLDVLALARGDEEESERLIRTCPRRGYTMNEWGFVGRWEAARKTTHFIVRTPRLKLYWEVSDSQNPVCSFGR